MNRPKATFYGTVQEGKVVFQREGIAQEFVQNLPDGYNVQVTIEGMPKEPSKAMWGYYWVICKALSNESGYTKDEMDEILCKEFLTVDKGTKNERVQSKTELSDEDFANLIDHSLQFGAMTFGVAVPPPDRNWRYSDDGINT